jgi:hypothetical protein
VGLRFLRGAASARAEGFGKVVQVFESAQCFILLCSLRVIL